MIKHTTDPMHILSTKQFTRPALEQLFTDAAAIEQLVKERGGDDRLKHRVIAALFYEPSTRTSSSFIAAAQRLGGSVVTINDVMSSSIAKGETLEDTVRTLEQYADAIVLRHPDIGAANLAASVASVPIINAGDGAGEHPTQALLDAFTIRRECGSIDTLTITIVGDLKHGRTVHSLVTLLNLFDVTLNFVSPKELQMPTDFKKQLGNPYTETTDLTTILASTDVLYMTRLQKERFADASLYEQVKGGYIVTPDLLKNAKKSLIIMHPLPRVDEISPDVDADPRAAYFRQMRYGLYMRMALLDNVIDTGASRHG